LDRVGPCPTSIDKDGPCHAEFISASLGSTKTDPETDPQILKYNQILKQVQDDIVQDDT